MVVYNVWHEDKNRWITGLTSIGKGKQDENKPIPLIYKDARKAVEHYRYEWARTPSVEDREIAKSFKVREVLPDFSPGDYVGFNIWVGSLNRWTNISFDGKNDQDTEYPFILNYIAAKEPCSKLGVTLGAEVREINSDLSSCPIYDPRDTLPKKDWNMTADYTINPAVVEVPILKSVVITTGDINFDIYNGFKSPPEQKRYFDKLVDPYTGLPIK